MIETLTGKSLVLARLGLLVLFLALPLRAKAAEGDITVAGQSGGACTTVAVSGHYAYLGEGMGLSILDLADSAHPAQVGRILMPKLTDPTLAVSGVAVNGNFAYVTDPSGLQIVDVSDPAAPRLRGRYDAANPGFLDVTVVGNLAYVAAREAGLVIVDVSDPDAPAFKGSLVMTDPMYSTTKYWVVDVAVSGNYAYLACLEGGFKVVNVTNPTAPTVVSSYDTHDMARSVAIVGSLAYIAKGESGVEIIDISAPSTPKHKGDIVSQGVALDVAVSGELALVAGQVGGLEIFDVTDPVNPVSVTRQDTPGVASGIVVSGNLAYVADEGGLQVINFAIPTLPSIVGAYLPLLRPTDLAVVGDLAYVANDLGLTVLDIHNPAFPRIRSNFPMPAPARNVAVAGGVAYVTDVPGIYQRGGAKGLWTIDVSNPDSPSELGQYQTLGEVWELVVADGKAYLAEGNKGLEIVNVSQPQSPAQLGIYTNASGLAYDVAIKDGIAYLADGLAGLVILDVSNPASIQVKSSYLEANSVHGVAVDGYRAYIAAEATFEILNVSNIASPYRAMRIDYAGQTKISAIQVAQDKVLFPDDSSRLKILDARNLTASPTSDTLLRGEPAELVVKDNLIFVVDEEGGLVILRNEGLQMNSVRTNWFLVR